MKRSVSNIKMDKNPAPTRRMKVSDNSDSPKAPTSDEVKLICDFFDSLEAKTAMYDLDDVKEAKKCLLEGMNINDIDLDVQSDTPYIRGPMPLLHHAILARDHRTFEILFKYTKDINLQDQSSGTPLILAVKVQDLDIVRQLLTHPDIDTEKKPLHFRPYTALVEAWWLNNEAIYSELAAAGANVRASGHYDNYLPGYGILDYDQCKKLQETVKIRECCIAFNNILEYPADKLKLGFENRIRVQWENLHLCRFSLFTLIS